MYDKKRKIKLDRIVDEGYSARVQGEKCESPYTRQLERAAWEIGWRAARNKIQQKQVPEEELCI